MVNKRISKIRSILFWLLLTGAALIFFGFDNLRQLLVDYQLDTPGLHKQAAADAVKNISPEESALPAGKARLKKKASEQVSTLPELIYASSEHFADINTANLDGLLKRIGNSRLVLLGESSHGSHEFYEMRARITQALIENKGFNIIAVEADWPDASRVNHFIRGFNHRPMFKDKPFSGFPEWMWANHSVLSFTHWLKDYNQRLNSTENAVNFYGLDLYNIYGSIRVVLDYLQGVDPAMADHARWHYGCLLPWISDPSLYSRDMRTSKHSGCEYNVSTVLTGLLKKQNHYLQLDKQQYFNAEQNARLVQNGERYFRTLYHDSTNSWNQRDQNMFETLQEILNYHGETSKAVIWAHNSHIGDSRATEFSARGEYNLGQLVREAYADNAYLIGFGTDHGTVAAATEWGGAMKVMQLQPSIADSYERQFHNVETDNFLLPLRNPMQAIMRDKLLPERPQRAVGVAYDPKAELEKHYFSASLPRQYDEYIWFDETRAVMPLSRER